MLFYFRNFQIILEASIIMEAIKRYFINNITLLSSQYGALLYDLYKFACRITNDPTYCEALIERSDYTTMILTSDNIFTVIVNALSDKMNTETIDDLINLFKTTDGLLERLQRRINSEWYSGNSEIKIVAPTSLGNYYKLRNRLFVNIVKSKETNQAF